ncbi:MAG: AAA family ATPase [Muribaculaceae bacterium]|nr:AAA family ATPase [Muribaculaceae bacterium]
MLYLKKFVFPDMEHDTLYFDQPRGSFYDENCYPFHITSDKGLWALDFEPITILYGGNGSGKSTIINVISEKLHAERKSMFNSSPYFAEYVSRCYYKTASDMIGESDYGQNKKSRNKYDLSSMTTVLTSDDIFNGMLNLRRENERKLNKSKFLTDEYMGMKIGGSSQLPKHLNFETGYNVDKYKEGVDLLKATRGKGHSLNKVLLDRIGKMERGYSNGETALIKLSELLEEPGLYLLDEPENSMSCEFQIRLASIITYLARYGDCQFIISSHSPFLLSMEGAKIYNLDLHPVDVCQWWELENMKHYFELFYNARDNFLSIST